MSYSPAGDNFGFADEALTIFADVLGDDASDLARYRTALQAATENLTLRFDRGESVIDLVRLRAQLVDLLLQRLWHTRAASLTDRAALVAVGGYGRGELHPFSDVDIMILRDAVPGDDAESALAAFIAALWDVGLEIGHSVRTIEDCRTQASDDITIATTLTETRLIAGPETLFAAMQAAVSAPQVWPSDRFFAAKLKEQQARHRRYDDTAYKLEPNVKGSPGGLRDIQVIGWVAKRHFGVRTLDELVARGFLTPGQRRILHDGQAFLWRVRFALHVLTGRREDRLLFDHQSRLAEMLGYEDASYTLAVEQMMQRYYRTVMELSRLNEMLLQQFEEAILLDPAAAPIRLDDNFQLRNGYLQTTHDNVFTDDPSLLLGLFVTLQEAGDIRGVSARTIGLIRRNLRLIDEEFRQNPRNHRLFLSILRAPAGVTRVLRRMNLYGVLGLYIPAFGRIVGRMQYDLFHAYTVDEHTLFVVSNLRRFALTRFDHEYPHCSPLMQSFEKPEIVYLAALFHDIAKGRGGDHSELGSVDAEAFCLEHGMSQYDARTVAWLVRNHLVLSMTAQKKDLSDPDVINEFAACVRDQVHLDYLYVLTVADVRGTNPKLWNSWKATLFRDLYELTSQALRLGLENPIDRDLLISETQLAAGKLLAEKDVTGVDRLWAAFGGDYFLRHRPDEIAWHAALLSATDASRGVLGIRRQPAGDGIEAVMYTAIAQRSFAHVTALLDQMGMTIVDVRIVPLNNQFSIDTYIFMEADRTTQIDDARIDKIRSALQGVLIKPDSDVTHVTRPAPRQVRMFSTKTLVTCEPDRHRRRTIVELVAGDRPGLLSAVARIFVSLDIDIETAKIMTIGERAEDVFYVVGGDGAPLDEASCQQLRDMVMQSIDAGAI